ncbi:hypothetical protein Tco_0369327, partial [Tanacetum coccineum]
FFPKTKEDWKLAASIACRTRDRTTAESYDPFMSLRIMIRSDELCGGLYQEDRTLLDSATLCYKVLGECKAIGFLATLQLSMDLKNYTLKPFAMVSLSTISSRLLPMPKVPVQSVRLKEGDPHDRHDGSNSFRTEESSTGLSNKEVSLRTPMFTTVHEFETGDGEELSSNLQNGGGNSKLRCEKENPLLADVYRELSINSRDIVQVCTDLSSFKSQPSVLLSSLAMVILIHSHADQKHRGTYLPEPNHRSLVTAGLTGALPVLLRGVAWLCILCKKLSIGLSKSGYRSTFLYQN